MAIHCLESGWNGICTPRLSRGASCLRGRISNTPLLSAVYYYNILWRYIHLGNIQLYNLIVPCLIHLTLFNIKCIYKQSKYGFRIRWQQCQFRKDQWMSQCVSVWETELGKIWPLFDNHHLKRVHVCLFKTSSLETLHPVIYWWKYLGGPIVLRLSLNFQAWHPCCPFVRCNRRGWFRPPSVDCNYLWVAVHSENIHAMCLSNAFGKL